MGPKNGSDFFQRFGHKIGPKAFPDVILARLDRKFWPGSFWKGPGVILGPKKGVKVGRKVPKMTKQNENWSENEVGRVIFLVDPGPNLFLPDRGDQNTSRGARGE